MNTFLPYEDFTRSAECLDQLRLGKQRVEVVQILKALYNPAYGWQHHPAVKMWRGSELGLAEYGVRVCDEWLRRGYSDGCRAQIEELAEEFAGAEWRPWWLGDERLHRSHRANLVRKDAEWYGRLWPEVEAEEGYWWPPSQVIQL